jgi:hypothetical protein
MLAGDSEPAPAVTAKVTVAPGTGFAFASATRTTSGLGSAVPSVPVWLLPETTETVAAGPACPVSEKATDARPVLAAVIVFVPAVFERVKVADTLPVVSDAALAGVTLALLDVVNRTVTPWTAFPFGS